jgi:hypothetical protein
MVNRTISPISSAESDAMPKPSSDASMHRQSATVPSPRWTRMQTSSAMRWERRSAVHSLGRHVRSVVEDSVIPCA